MSRTQKEKLEAITDTPIQLISEISVEENAVTAADGYNLDRSQEKRKKDANKPLYLDRI